MCLIWGKGGWGCSWLLGSSCHPPSARHLCCTRDDVVDASLQACGLEVGAVSIIQCQIIWRHMNLDSGHCQQLSQLLWRERSLQAATSLPFRQVARWDGTFTMHSSIAIISSGPLSRLASWPDCIHIVLALPSCGRTEK